ncbi:MAG TPA: serine protease [Nitrososphaeraceae archaeon]|nr:serine protease [Nitrososphaeraceae archaeon]
MQSNQDSVQDLRRCTVAIQSSSSKNKVLGTGVIVTSDGLILTCYHVVGSIRNKSLDEIVDVRFPLIHDIRAHAHPISEYCNPELDIAFLQLEGNLPEQTTPAILSETIVRDDNYQSFGFRDPNKVKGGLYSRGTIQGKTYDNPLREIIQLTIDHNRSEVPYGMSGAPVLDINTNKIIGIIRCVGQSALSSIQISQ